VGIESILTFIGVGAIVLVLAAYLITIAVTLNNVSFTVGTILIGVRAIAAQCQPIGPVVRDIAREVQAIDDDLEALLTAGEEELQRGRVATR